MESNTKNLRELETVQLKDTITSIAGSLDTIAVGLLDDFVHLWNQDQPTFQIEPLLTFGGNGMGVISITYDSSSSRLAASCLDSNIRVYDLTTKMSPEIIECQMMQNWKIVHLNKCFVTGGDNGRISFFNDTSKERDRKIDTGDVFLTSIAKSNDENFLATGNNNGDLHIVNLTIHGREKIASLKTHYKQIRTISFIEDSSKLLTGSDDCSIKLVDIASEKVVATLEGHRQPVSHICCPSITPNVFYSSSFDKSLKIWDLRSKACVGSAVTTNPLWSCHVNRNKVFAGGEAGLLSVYSLQ